MEGRKGDAITGIFVGRVSLEGPGELVREKGGLEGALAFLRERCHVTSAILIFPRRGEAQGKHEASPYRQKESVDFHLVLSELLKWDAAVQT